MQSLEMSRLLEADTISPLLLAAHSISSPNCIACATCIILIPCPVSSPLSPNAIISSSYARL